MAEPGLVIIIAQGADVKLANCLLLHIREADIANFEPKWHIMRTFGELQVNDLPADVLPIQDFNYNEYEGMQLEKLESILLTEPKVRLFLVLDNEGAQSKNVILVQRDDEFDMFHKMRIPWQEVHPVWNNINVLNITFEECIKETKDFVDPVTRRVGGGWWTWNSVGWGLSGERVAARDAALKELKKLDLA